MFSCYILQWIQQWAAAEGGGPASSLMPDVEIFWRWEDLIACLYFLKTGPPKTISFYLEETDPVRPCNYAVDELKIQGQKVEKARKGPQEKQQNILLVAACGCGAVCVTLTGL